MFKRIRKFFKDSEVIFLSYVHAVLGAVVGALSYFDWNKLLSMVQSATPKQLLLGGSAVLFAQGLMFYVARIARAKDL